LEIVEPLGITVKLEYTKVAIRQGSLTSILKVVVAYIELAPVPKPIDDNDTIFVVLTSL
jgi:hypothetical protein